MHSDPSDTAFAFPSLIVIGGWRLAGTTKGLVLLGMRRSLVGVSMVVAGRVRHMHGVG